LYLKKSSRRRKTEKTDRDYGRTARLETPKWTSKNLSRDGRGKSNKSGKKEKRKTGIDIVPKKSAPGRITGTFLGINKKREGVWPIRWHSPYSRNSGTEHVR